VFCAALVCAACGLRNQKPMAVPPRIPDSPREKRDDIKNLPPPVGLQADEDRWGVEKAKEMKRIKAENKADKASSGALIPMPSPDGETTAPAATEEEVPLSPRYIVK
jgi:hypothetical protein